MARPNALKKLDKNPITLERMLRNWQRLHFRGFADAMPVFEPIYIAPGETPAESGIAVRLNLDYGTTTYDGTEYDSKGQPQDVKYLGLALADATLEFVADTGVRVNIGSTGGISFDVNGLYILLPAESGLITDATGLRVYLTGFTGLDTDANGLFIDLRDSSLTIDAGGIGVNVDSTSGLGIDAGGLYIDVRDTSLLLDSSGLGVALADTSLEISSGLKVRLATSSGLEISTGLKIDPADTSLTLSASGVGVAIADTSLEISSGLKVRLNSTASGLEVSTGLRIDVSDTSLTLAAGGVSVNLWSTGGLALDANGLYWRGFRVRSSEPSSPTEGDAWYRSDLDTFRVRRGSDVQELSSIIYINSAQSADLSNPTTETFFDKFGTIPDGLIKSGKCFRVRAYGEYVCGAGTVDIRIRMRELGGTLLLNRTAVTVDTTAATRSWCAECTFIVVSEGSGTMLAGGFVSTENSNVASNAAPTTTFNQTDYAIKVSWEFNTSNGSNVARLFVITLEAMN